jgi:hypothetical protein
MTRPDAPKVIAMPSNHLPTLFQPLDLDARD